MCWYCLKNFETIVRDSSADFDALTWSFETVNEEIYTFIKKYISGKAKKAFMTSESGGFEAYRKMVLEVDPVNHRTKAAMMDALTGMI